MQLLVPHTLTIIVVWSCRVDNTFLVMEGQGRNISILLIMLILNNVFFFYFMFINKRVRWLKLEVWAASIKVSLDRFLLIKITIFGKTHLPYKSFMDWEINSGRETSNITKHIGIVWERKRRGRIGIKHKGCLNHRRNQVSNIPHHYFCFKLVLSLSLESLVGW